MFVPPGTRIDRYEVERPLGAGGMGQIYLARDTRLERPVAVKLLARNLAGDAHLVERFRREARALLSLNHPHLLTVYDVGEVGGTPYFVTEVVEGTTLRELMDRRDLPPRESLRLVAQAASALAAAHARGIVHRDVKPENLMVRHDGYVKVLDFGVAKLLEPGGPAGGGRGTVASAMVGTVRYMSPEQLRGEDVDARADVWGLGAVLYELLTDSLPFPGRTAPDVIAAILRLPLVPPSETAPGRVPAELDALLARCLAKDRGARFAGCAELAAELEALDAALRARGGGGADAGEGGVGGARVGGGARSDSDPTGAWREISAALHEADALPAPRHNLPAQATSFLGRESELGAVTAALRRPDVRLLVLTGPGGAGKTRLALEAAALLARDYVDGVWHVPLAALSDPAAVPEAIAAALAVKELGEGTPLEGLVRWLRGRRLLLLLDNFEQVAGAAPVLAALLGGAPGVELLVTSRETLRVRGEHDFPVPPLELPPAPRAGAAPAPGALAEVPAVALFVSRAAALDPGFALDEGNAAAVAELCRRLDGLPLAIELAAARVRVLSPQAMLRRLDDRFRLLGGGGAAADLPDRHRTLRGTLDWGHELLSARERRLFRRLGVFRGGFGLAAIEAICADDAGEAGEALDLVASLVDKSLVQRIEAPRSAGVASGAPLEAEPRFTLLETVRDYARTLLEPEERALLRERHAAFHLALARRAGPDAAAAAIGRSIAELALAHDDVRAALEWAAEQEDPEELLRFTAALWWFWYLHGDYGEGRRWTAQALSRGGGAAGSPERARTLLGAGVLALLQCDYPQAEERLGAARELAEGLGERAVVAAALQWSGSVAREQGRTERALALHGASLELWRELGDEPGVARSLNFLAFACWLHGDTVEAARLAAEAEERFGGLGDDEGLVWALLNRTAVALHGVAHREGDLRAARELGREALALAGASAYREGEAWSLDLLGTAALREGRPERAEGLLQRSLELHRELGDRWRMASVLEGLAAVARARGSVERGVRLDAAAARLRELIGTPPPPVETAGREEERAAARAALGAERAAACAREGREMGTERAVAYALQREDTGGAAA